MSIVSQKEKTDNKVDIKLSARSQKSVNQLIPSLIFYGNVKNTNVLAVEAKKNNGRTCYNGNMC